MANMLSLLSNSNVTALSVNESKVIEDLKANYGDNFAEKAKLCLMCDKSNNATHIIKCKAIYNAIFTYNTNCTELKKQQTARTAFSNATGISATDITRYMGIYALRSLWMNHLSACNSAKNDIEKEKTIDCYMSKYDYSKLVEIAKLREDEKLYILDECEDTLYMYTKSQLLFMLEPYKMEIAPLNGRDNEFKNRKQWIDDKKKIKDYGKEEDKEEDSNGNDSNGNDSNGNDSNGNDSNSNDSNSNDSNGNDSNSNDSNSNDSNSGNKYNFNIEDVVKWAVDSLTDEGKVDIIKQIFDTIEYTDSMKEICDYTATVYSLSTLDDDDLNGGIEE